MMARRIGAVIDYCDAFAADKIRKGGKIPPSGPEKERAGNRTDRD